MINNEAFIKRLKIVIDYYGESASSFAEKIEVQRSSISHILSGRNKPSLEFVLKVLSSFPEIELYWLMNGKGNFPSDKNALQNSNDKLEQKSNSQHQEISSPQKSETLTSEISETKKHSSSLKKEIDRIIIFYKDGSFSNFEN